jgi:hypothetical protein
MELWRKLYNTVWLAFFSCVLIPRWMGPYAGFPIHSSLGLLMAVVALSNASRLGALAVPGRLKRVSKVMAGLSCLQLIIGMAMGGVAHLAPHLPYVPRVLYGIHIVCALAILSQASSVATGYDMWEEKEFAPAPGDVQG